MSRIWRVSKGDSADLGFARTCLWAGVIDLTEFKSWAERVVAETATDALPPHLIDLMMVTTRDEVLTRAQDILGFLPQDPFLTPERCDALDALALCRGLTRGFHTDWTTEAEGADLLARFPEVVDRFRDLFPEIPIEVPKGLPLP